MQAIFALVCVSLVLHSVYSAVYIQQHVDKPDEFVQSVYNAVVLQPPVKKPYEIACEEGCFIPDLYRVLDYNVPFSPQDGKTCLQYTCQNNGDTQIFSCGSIQGGPGCQIIPGDLTKPYPNCCDDVVCDPSAEGATATATA